MRFDFNIKVILLLIALSIITLVIHRSGLVKIVLPLTHGKHVHSIEKLDSITNNISADIKGNTIVSRCDLKEAVGFNYCGIFIGLGPSEISKGIDLSHYDKLILNLHYEGPTQAPKVKVAFRNYDPAYSSVNDAVSLQFNSISYKPSLLGNAITVPLKSLQVENWWVQQYNLAFEHSQIDLTNIAAIEFITFEMPVAGEYEIRLESAILTGQIISETDLLKLILLIWLVSIIILVSVQRNKLETLATTDSLTNLYNRRGVSQWVDRASFKKHASLTMFYIDIDDFKKVNDTYGHIVGDELLVGFCQRINNYLNAKDTPEHIFARLSGDEFTIIYQNITDAQVTVIASQIIYKLSRPIILQDHQIHTHASIGIAQTQQGVDSFVKLLVRADSAMYYAKKRGKNQFKLFDEHISKDIFFRKEVARKIKEALRHDQFHINFMPIYHCNSLEMAKVEVLLRCHDQAMQGIGPDVFIPIAEDYELIKDIDFWVIEATFKQLNNEHCLLKNSHLIFCINISAAELNNDKFVAELNRLLNKYLINPKNIELEITETSLIQADERSITILKEINALGITLALDDFGTGYTAFNQLINYPVDCLKIDKSFIDGLATQHSTQLAMIKAIISIAKAYQLSTIAEGVETKEQYILLQELNCDMIQGYIFGKPVIWETFKLELVTPKTELLLEKVR